MDDLHKLFKNLRTASEILELVENHFDDDTDAQEAFSADIETIKSARAAVWEMWNNNSQFPDEFHEDLDNLSDDDLSKWYRAAFTFPIERVHDWTLAGTWVPKNVMDPLGSERFHQGVFPLYRRHGVNFL